MKPSRFRINAPAAVSEVLDGEAVIMNLESGHYFSARALGGVLWEAIIAGASVPELAEAVANTWQSVDLPPPLQEFVDKLLEHKLIVADLAREHSDAEPALAKALQLFAGRTYQEPALDVFTDMQDLLLLDPIHDVGEAGWPMPMAPDSGPA